MVKKITYQNRRELLEAGLHNSIQRGIGRAKDGTGYISIVLSGGYEDDRDYGDEIIYTGEGGRDERSGKQVADQTILSSGNRNLISSHKEKQPIYVTRGFKHISSHSPRIGYEFAGLYNISEYWMEKGISGFSIVRFRLKKINADKD